MGRTDGYRRRTILAPLGLGVLMLTIPVTALACPCTYKLDGFPDISSDKPIPAAHAVCLRSVEEFVKGKRKFIANSNREKARAAHEKSLRIILDTDWGVPSTETANALIEQGKRVISETQETLATERRKLGDPGHIQEIVRDNISLDESTVLMRTKFIEYARCVLKNDLPPTAK